MARKPRTTKPAVAAAAPAAAPEAAAPEAVAPAAVAEQAAPAPAPAASAAPAPKPNADIQILVVTGPRKGFRRAGRLFGAEPVRIPLADLTEAEAVAICEEPRLKIELTTAPTKEG